MGTQHHVSAIKLEHWDRDGTRGRTQLTLENAG